MVNPNVYDRLEDARAELAFLTAILPFTAETTLSQHELSGLNRILERAQHAMDALLEQEQEGARQ
jgi:hypothetical protein